MNRIRTMIDREKSVLSRRIAECWERMAAMEAAYQAGDRAKLEKHIGMIPDITWREFNDLRTP